MITFLGLISMLTLSTKTAVAFFQSRPIFFAETAVPHLMITLRADKLKKRAKCIRATYRPIARLLSHLSSVEWTARVHTPNELPQPQVCFTCGLSNLNPEPSSA